MKKTNAVTIFAIVTLTAAYFSYRLVSGLNGVDSLGGLKVIMGILAALVCGPASATGVLYILLETGTYVSNAVSRLAAVWSFSAFLGFAKAVMKWEFSGLTRFCLLIIWGVLICMLADRGLRGCYSSKITIIPVSIINAAALMIVLCIMLGDYNLATFPTLYVSVGAPCIVVLMFLDRFVVEERVRHPRFCD